MCDTIIVILSVHLLYINSMFRWKTKIYIYMTKSMQHMVIHKASLIKDVNHMQE